MATNKRARTNDDIILFQNENVKRNFTELAHYMDKVQTERNQTKEQLRECNELLQAKTSESESYAVKVKEQDEEIKKLNRDIDRLNDELDSKDLELRDTLQNLDETERHLEEIHVQLDNERAKSTEMALKSEEMKTELTRYKNLTDAARLLFMDCITLDISATCIPTTTGQVCNYERLHHCESLMIGTGDQFRGADQSLASRRPIQWRYLVSIYVPPHQANHDASAGLAHSGAAFPPWTIAGLGPPSFLLLPSHGSTDRLCRGVYGMGAIHHYGPDGSCSEIRPCIPSA